MDPTGFELTEDLLFRLETEFQLTPGATHLVRLVTGTLIAVAADIARDYDEEEGYDQNLAGLLCSGRTRNLVAAQIRSEDIAEQLDIQVQGSGLGTVLNGGGTGVHPYSCGSGDTPVLAGSTTKKRVLKEGAEQLTFFSAAGETFKPRHVVVAYSRDLEGVVSAKVGMMSGAEEFAWELPIYHRPARTEGNATTSGDPWSTTLPSHDHQPVEEPAVKLRNERDLRADQ